MEISNNKRKKQETISHFCIVNNSQQKKMYTEERLKGNAPKC